MSNKLLGQLVILYFTRLNLNVKLSTVCKVVLCIFTYKTGIIYNIVLSLAVNIG